MTFRYGNSVYRPDDLAKRIVNHRKGIEEDEEGAEEFAHEG